MNIILFIGGMLATLFVVIAGTWALGWSTGSIIAFAVASLVTAQILYFMVMAAHAWFRAARHSPQTPQAAHDRSDIDDAFADRRLKQRR